MADLREAQVSTSSNGDRLISEDVYSSLPPGTLHGNPYNPNETKRRELWNAYLLNSIPDGGKIKSGLEKAQNFENLTVLERKKKKKKKKCKSKTSMASMTLKTAGCRKKASKLTLPSSNVKFSTFIPLSEMWTSYIDKVIDISRLSPSNRMDAANKLMKADLHGCPVVVQKSKCPSYIGVSGIVIQETRNIFVLITRSDLVKRIPKKNSIFSIVLGSCVFSIHGNHFLTSPGNRAGKRFKAKPTIDL